MNLENYTVAVRLSLVENVSRGLVALGGRFAALNAQATLFQSKLNALKHQVAVGAAMFAGGAAIASPFVYATIQAGKLQQQLKAVQLATSASANEMEHFRRTVDRVAETSIFKSVDIATMAKTLATANTFNPSQVEQLLPSFAKFATSQQLIKGTSITKSTEQAIQLAEITGHFTPDSINKTLDAFTKLSLLMPGSIDKVLGAFKYAEGTMKNVMGVSDEDTLLMVAMLQRMGVQGTRAGSQMLALVSRSIPNVFGSGLWVGQSKPQLGKMGFLDSKGNPDIYDQAGKFSFVKFFGHLGTYVHKEFAQNAPGVARSDIMKTFQQTFGTMGTRIASLFINPKAIDELNKMGEAFAKFPNLDVVAGQMDGLFSKQLQQTISLFGTLFASLGNALLPSATGGLKGFNDQLIKMIEYVDTHQDTIRMFEEAILGLAGALIVGGSIIMLRAALMGLLIPVQMLTGFATLLFPSLAGPILGLSAPVAAAIAGVVALGVAIYEMYKHWDFLVAKVIEWNSYLSHFEAYNIARRGFQNLWDAIILPIKPAILAFEFLFNTIQKGINLLKPQIVPLAQSGFKKIEDGFNYLFPNAKNPFAYGSGDSVNNSPLSSSGNGRLPNAGASSPHVGSMSPIHVHVNIDGHKVATAVVGHVTRQIGQVPSSGSVFDSRLSHVPTVLNNMGY